MKALSFAGYGPADVLRVEERAIPAVGPGEVLVKVHADPQHFRSVVRSAMTDRLETLSPAAGIDDLLQVFDRGRVAIVMDGDRFLGLITRSDLLSYLRLQFT